MFRQDQFHKIFFYSWLLAKTSLLKHFVFSDKDAHYRHIILLCKFFLIYFQFNLKVKFKLI